MVSKTKNESKNIYLQTLIAEILRSCDETSAKSISEIKHILEKRYDYKCAYKTVARNIKGMSDHFKLSEIGEKPVRYWIDSYYEPDFSIELNPFQIQLITYSLRNMASQSTKPLSKAIKETEIALLNQLPSEIKKELRHALRTYTVSENSSPPRTWPQNNINEIFRAIRKKKNILAKLKIKGLTQKERHIMREFSIKTIYFEYGIPMIDVYDFHDNQKRTISATQLNSIKLIKA